MTDAFRLSDSVLHLDGATIDNMTNEPEFWDRSDRPELSTGHVLSVFSYTDTWDYQERHGDGDELAVVLDGQVDLLLDQGEGELPVGLRSGQAGIVPAGAWHRIAVHRPSAVLFITPAPSRTDHRRLT